MSGRPAGAASAERLEASVLVPLYRDADQELILVVVRRTEGGAHGGQLAFPGGKPEPADRNREETAARETREEIGLGADGIEILDRFPPVDTLTTGFRVFPFLARVTPPPAWVPEPEEVAEVLEVKVRDLARPEARGRAVESFPGLPGPIEIPFFRVGPHRLWGLSFRIVEPLIPRLLAGEWRI